MFNTKIESERKMKARKVNLRCVYPAYFTHFLRKSHWLNIRLRNYIVQRYGNRSDTYRAKFLGKRSRRSLTVVHRAIDAQRRRKQKNRRLYRERSIDVTRDNRSILWVIARCAYMLHYGLHVKTFSHHPTLLLRDTCAVRVFLSSLFVILAAKLPAFWEKAARSGSAVFVCGQNLRRKLRTIRQNDRVDGRSSRPATSGQ